VGHFLAALDGGDLVEGGHVRRQAAVHAQHAAINDLHVPPTHAHRATGRSSQQTHVYRVKGKGKRGTHTHTHRAPRPTTLVASAQRAEGQGTLWGDRTAATVR
jgi:hypothetical protein